VQKIGVVVQAWTFEREREMFVEESGLPDDV
jgi:hypothetical protein